MRQLKFENGCFYHIYNRGVDKRKIAANFEDYKRFSICLKLFNNISPIISLRQALRNFDRLLEPVNSKPLVEIVCYALLPNHFHLMLKQISEDGISKFMLKLGMGYTNYFNTKYDRSGSLFQGSFKAVKITSDEYLLYLSGYINGNPEIHGLSRKSKWPWSSFHEYKNRKSEHCQLKYVLRQFKRHGDYTELVNSVIKNAKKTKGDVKKYLFE